VAHTLLAVPVPAADPLVRELTARWEPTYDLGTDADVMAHVTVLGPFVAVDRVAAIDALVREVVGAASPFEFVLAAVGRFAGDVVYLRPEPAAPFLALTAELHRRFPDHPPYGGRFSDVQPHLTVGPIGSADMERDLVAAAEAVVPLRCVADEVRLILNDHASFRTLARYPLGNSLAGAAE
jgi:hypothetical protein